MGGRFIPDTGVKFRNSQQEDPLRGPRTRNNPGKLASGPRTARAPSIPRCAHQACRTVPRTCVPERPPAETHTKHTHPAAAGADPLLGRGATMPVVGPSARVKLSIEAQVGSLSTGCRARSRAPLPCGVCPDWCAARGRASRPRTGRARATRWRCCTPSTPAPAPRRCVQRAALLSRVRGAPRAGAY